MGLIDLNTGIIGSYWFLQFPVIGMIIPEMGNFEGHAKPVSIAEALFSGVRQRLIGLLFVEADRAFFTNEIARRIRSGRGALERELRSFTSSGLIIQTRSGRQTYYQANRQSPIFSEIRAIALKTFGLADVLRDCLAELPTPASYAFVFGSVAKGGDTASSDIDLMVVADGLSHAQLFEVLAEVESRLGRKINPVLYTVDEFRRRVRENDHFVRRILEQQRIDLLGALSDVSDEVSA